MNKLVCVKVFDLRMEAEMARGFLDANGIKARVISDDVGGTNPSLLLGTGGARLMVQAADVDEAEKLLEALDSEADIEEEEQQDDMEGLE